MDALLVGYGPLGIIVVWLATRVENRLTKVERGLDRTARALDAHTRSILLEVLTRPQLPRTIEVEAHKILSILESETKGDGK